MRHKIAKRPTQGELVAADMRAIGDDGSVSEDDVREMAELMRAAVDGGDYATRHRTPRLVGDGIEPAVFSDGRGNGSWEDHCWYCGVAAATMIQEHMLPSSRHGSDDAHNLVAACQRCNSRKRDRSVEEFRALMEQRTGVESFAFAGEVGLCVVSGSPFAYVHTVPLSDRARAIAASLARKNPDPPAPSIGDLFKNNPAKGLL